MSSTNLIEITDLFAQLALNLKILDPTANNEDREEAGIDLSISNLNRSFNLDETSSSRVRVLDTALSLMCFKAPQVYETVIKFLVNTLVTMLSSSIACKSLKFQKAEYMHVGSEISRSDCAELIESCADILQKLEECRVPYQSLLYALVKAAVSASCFDYGLGVVPIFNANSLERVKPTLSKLHSHLSSDLFFKDEEIPLRLLFWYLDPMILKNDVSNMLKDIIHRPFICLETAFHEKMEWRNVLLCLTISPAMFVETRTLLHNWFLMTGLASVLELEIKLVSSILDVIHRPLWWGLPMELGLKLPSSSAYFTYNHHLLKTLQGPMLCQTLLDIVHITKNMAHHSHTIDHKSPWSVPILLLNKLF